MTANSILESTASCKSASVCMRPLSGDIAWVILCGGSCSSRVFWPPQHSDMALTAKELLTLDKWMNKNRSRKSNSKFLMSQTQTNATSLKPQLGTLRQPRLGPSRLPQGGRVADRRTGVSLDLNHDLEAQGVITSTSCALLIPGTF